MAKYSHNKHLSKEDFLSIIGERIEKFRKEKGLEVLDLVGDDLPIKSRQHWRRIEMGQKDVKLVTIMGMAQTLKMDIGQLLKGLKVKF